MSSEWEKTGKERYDAVEKVAEVYSCGIIQAPKITEVRNTETGDVKEVSHHTEKGLGEKIESGRFMPKKN